MSAKTGIEWCDSTVNFWWGCTKVGPGCDYCYAETWSKRTGESIWGVGAPRRRIKGAVALIRKLDGNAGDFEMQHGRTRRVFVQSMSDLFDVEVPLDWFAEAWLEIDHAQMLDIQIVTKRISVVEKRLASIGRGENYRWPSHAGLIITVCNQDEADRDIPRLLALKAKLGIPWVGLSIEPMLGPILMRGTSLDRQRQWNWLTGESGVMHPDGPDFDIGPRLDWVIVGGESGPGARPMHPDWPRSLRDQCAAAGVAFFFKQWGEWRPRGGTTWSEWIMRDGSRHSGSFETRQHLESVLPLDSCGIERVGKKRAGRLLDGIEHNGFPEVRP